MKPKKKSPKKKRADKIKLPHMNLKGAASAVRLLKNGLRLAAIKHLRDANEMSLGDALSVVNEWRDKFFVLPIAPPAPQGLQKSILERLTEKVERVNALQHSGGRIIPEDWNELVIELPCSLFIRILKEQIK